MEIFFHVKRIGLGLEAVRERNSWARLEERDKNRAERAEGREGLTQRESSVLAAAVECLLPMVCSWIRNQKGLGLVYSWGLLRTLEGFAFV